MIDAKVIQDSVADTNGRRILTFQLRYPRFIHAELMTHRALSRNASSSRAIPVAKMIEQVEKSPAKPLHWGKNQPGMQAYVELTGRERELAEELWETAAANAASIAMIMNQIGVHKQVANRILEPFQFMHVVVTATELDNFFELRDHEAAEPNIQALARAMRSAMDASEPVLRPMDRQHERAWHLPYVTDEERIRYADTPRFLAKLSGARCARVSFLNHDGTNPDLDKDIELYRRLVGSRPLHASPVEHQAYPLPNNARSRNFVGWRQHREVVEFETQFATDYPEKK